MNEANIVADPSVSTIPNGSDAIFDIDKIFGDESVGDTTRERSDSTGWKTNVDAFSDIKTQASVAGQGSNFVPQTATPRNPQEVISKLQSERDKLKSELDKFQVTANDWRSAYDLLSEIETDAEIRRAYIAQVEPELLKPKDSYSFIKERLEKEFEGFTPSADEANVIGSKTWIYNERAKELLTEAKGGKLTLPGSLKEIRERRKQATEENKKMALKEKADIISSLKWDDQTWDGFAGWMGAAKGVEFAKLYNYMLKKSIAPNSPNLASQAGYNWKTDQGAVFGELNKFFG